MKVALVDVEALDSPIPLESYTMRQGKVWAIICELFLTIQNGVIIDRPTPATKIRLVKSIRR